MYLCILIISIYWTRRQKERAVVLFLMMEDVEYRSTSVYPFDFSPNICFKAHKWYYYHYIYKRKSECGFGAESSCRVKVCCLCGLLFSVVNKSQRTALDLERTRFRSNHQTLSYICTSDVLLDRRPPSQRSVAASHQFNPVLFSPCTPVSKTRFFLQSNERLQFFC